MTDYYAGQPYRPDVRYEPLTRWNDDGTVYACGDDGLFCELSEIDGAVTCLNCGDRPDMDTP